jgi:hypothetical protein
MTPAVLALFSVQLALTASAGGERRAPGNADLALEVTPAIVLADQDIRAVVRVRPDSANRLLTIALDGEFYSSTERSLDGDRAARTYEFNFRKLPAGEYMLHAEVEDATGRVRRIERRITVRGETDTIEPPRRKR